MNEKIGVFLSRMQPLHIGHLGMIDKALSENDKVIILIGSSNKKETIRNPLGVEIRREILEEALEEKYGMEYKVDKSPRRYLSVRRTAFSFFC